MYHCNCGSDILIDIIHPPYHFAFLLCVYADMLIFVPTLPPSPQTLCLSHTHSLSVSLSPLSSSHIKTHGNLFCLSLIAIKSSDKPNTVVSLKGLNTIYYISIKRYSLVRRRSNYLSKKLYNIVHH